MTDIEKTAPFIVDPGADGWPAEPKVTHAEVLLYGDLAGSIRLLGEAVAKACDAYALICKRAHEAPTTLYSLDYEIQRSWQAYCALRGTYFELAQRAMERVRQIEARNVQANAIPRNVGGGGASWLLHVMGDSPAVVFESSVSSAG